MGMYDKLHEVWEIEPDEDNGTDFYDCTYDQHCNRVPTWAVKRKGHKYEGDALCSKHGGSALAHIAEWTMGSSSNADDD